MDETQQLNIALNDALAEIDALKRINFEKTQRILNLENELLEANDTISSLRRDIIFLTDEVDNLEWKVADLESGSNDSNI